jgi:hypothetical protein
MATPAAPNTMPASAPATALAARTCERVGLNRIVGRIVPKRYSLVTSNTPAMAANTPARLLTLSSERWSSVVASPLVWVSSPVSSVMSSVSAINARISAIVVRVERIFRSSARICAIMPWPPR